MRSLHGRLRTEFHGHVVNAEAVLASGTETEPQLTEPFGADAQITAEVNLTPDETELVAANRHVRRGVPQASKELDLVVFAYREIGRWGEQLGVRWRCGGKHCGQRDGCDDVLAQTGHGQKALS